MSILPTFFGAYGSSTGSNFSAILMVFLGLIGFAALVFMIVCIWKIFVKAGRPGWQSIIPIYNSWVIAEIGGKPGWWGLSVFLGIIPFFGSILALVVWVFIMMGVARNFGKSDNFGIFGLTLFPIYGYPVLAYGKATYKPVHANHDTPDGPTN